MYEKLFLNILSQSTIFRLNDHHFSDKSYTKCPHTIIVLQKVISHCVHSRAKQWKCEQTLIFFLIIIRLKIITHENCYYMFRVISLASCMLIFVNFGKKFILRDRKPFLVFIISPCLNKFTWVAAWHNDITWALETFYKRLCH